MLNERSHGFATKGQKIGINTLATIQRMRLSGAPTLGKAITTRAKDVGVGLIADRRGETRAAAEHHCHRKWPRVHSHRRGDFKRNWGEENGDRVVADRLG